MMKFILILCFVVVFSEAQQKKCPRNQEWARGISPCPATCQFQNPPCHIATFAPINGCRCKDGYVLENENSTRCIHVSQCPRKCSKPNQQWNDCGTRCPTTCQNKNEDIACVKICQPGCFCTENTILDEFSLECVPENQC